MTDAFVPTPAVPAAPAPAADPSTAAVAAAVEAMIPQSQYDQEIARHAKERSFYKPAQRILSDLDEDSQAALLSLAEAVRRGDTDTIIDWSLDTARSLSGGDLAAAIARRQAGETAGAPTAPTQGVPAQQQPTPEQYREWAREEAKTVQQQATNKALVDNKLAGAGFAPDSAHARTIIEYAVANNIPPQNVDQAIGWYKTELGAYAQMQNAAAADAAAVVQLPPTAPNGAPIAGAPAANMGPKDRAMARLTRPVG